MSVTEIINEVRKLSSEERRQVLEALRQTEIPPTDEEKRAPLHRHLIAEGMLTAVPPRRNLPRDFEPVPIEGKPLSETIIEERR